MIHILHDHFRIPLSRPPNHYADTRFTILFTDTGEILRVTLKGIDLRDDHPGDDFIVHIPPCDESETSPILDEVREWIAGDEGLRERIRTELKKELQR